MGIVAVFLLNRLPINSDLCKMNRIYVELTLYSLNPHCSKAGCTLCCWYTRLLSRKIKKKERRYDNVTAFEA